MGIVTRCPRDCPDGCTLIAEEEKGGLTFRGNPNHATSLGFICGKTKRFTKNLTSPHRIREPWIKRGGRFHQASWEEALSLTAERLQAAVAEDPASVLMLRGYASLGLSKAFYSYVFEKLGARFTSGSICDGAGIEAIKADCGALDMNAATEIEKARQIMLWGKSPDSSAHITARVKKAKAAGAKVFAVGIDNHRVKPLVDYAVMIRPSTDRFFAFAVIKLLLESGNIETTLNKASNSSEFIGYLNSLSLEDLLAKCDATREEAEQVAKFYNEAKETATICSWGLQRYLYGGENVRAIHALTLLAGTLGIPGGGFYYNISSGRHITKPSGRAAPPPQPLPLTHLGSAIAENNINFAWVACFNPANQCPDAKAVKQGLATVGTIVVADAFWTETAKCADIVLPVALWPEEYDLAASAFWNEISILRPVAKRPKGVKSDFEILSDLAKRLKLDIEYETLDEWLSACIPGGRETLERLRREDFIELEWHKVAWEGGFAHADGKFSLLTTLSEEPARDPSHPLTLLTHVRGDFMHSQILPEEETLPLPIRVHPITAAAHSMKSGDPLRVVSCVGELEGELHLDPDLHPDVVAVPRGGWLSLGAGVNEVTLPLTSDIGGCAAYYQTGVRLEPARTEHHQE
ncbi:MAG: hypothetical protein C0609_02625 [Deltaproteobacteria bacterium]|nr:MAG: hypothetical protein C0609_02625 [Deltaproteobacteria bacterium]